MFYGIFALILFSLILIATEYQNRCCWFFLLMAAGMILSFLSLSLYLNKFGNYSFSFSMLFGLDYKIFLLVNRLIKLPLSTLTRLMNTGIVLYLLVVPLFIYDLTHSTTSGIKRIVLLIILAVYNFCFYDPIHAYLIYLNSHHAVYSGLYSKIISVMHHVNQVWIFIYLFYPVFILFRSWKQNSTRFIKRQIFLLAFCLGGLDLLFYSIFFVSPFMMSPAKAITTGFWIFENVQMAYGLFYPIIPLLTVGLLLLILLLLLNYRLGSLVHLFVDRKIHRDLLRMNEVISDLLHSEKNLLFRILILAKQTVGERDSPGAMLETAEKIRDLADESLSRTSENLDILRDLRYQMKENSVFSVLDEALSKANLDSSIALIFNKNEKDARLKKCQFDHYHMSRALINLLNNAAEAIRASDGKEGIIKIDVVVQFQWIFIIIQDNGIGIKKEALKHLFDPYYSDKTQAYHWGLGLSYVFKVVKSHMGQIRVESKWGEGTTIQIILPLITANR